MIIALTTNQGFESFQLWWHALIFGGRGTDIENALMKKLSRLSRPGPDRQSRVLLRPCEVVLSDVERATLLGCFARTTWQQDRFQDVERAVALFGGRVERKATAGRADPGGIVAGR